MRYSFYKNKPGITKSMKLSCNVMKTHINHFLRFSQDLGNLRMDVGLFWLKVCRLVSHQQPAKPLWAVQVLQLIKCFEGVKVQKICTQSYEIVLIGTHGLRLIEHWNLRCEKNNWGAAGFIGWLQKSVQLKCRQKKNPLSLFIKGFDEWENRWFVALTGDLQGWVFQHQPA